MPSSSSSGCLMIRLGPCGEENGDAQRIPSRGSPPWGRRGSPDPATLTSASTLRSESVMRQAISRIWSFSTSRPVICHTAERHRHRGLPPLPLRGPPRRPPLDPLAPYPGTPRTSRSTQTIRCPMPPPPAMAAARRRPRHSRPAQLRRRPRPPRLPPSIAARPQSAAAALHFPACPTAAAPGRERGESARAAGSGSLGRRERRERRAGRDAGPPSGYRVLRCEVRGGLKSCLLLPLGKCVRLQLVPAWLQLNQAGSTSQPPRGLFVKELHHQRIKRG